jgi:hypothetical protein
LLPTVRDTEAIAHAERRRFLTTRRADRCKLFRFARKAQPRLEGIARSTVNLGPELGYDLGGQLGALSEDGASTLDETFLFAVEEIDEDLDDTDKRRHKALREAGEDFGTPVGDTKRLWTTVFLEVGEDDRVTGDGGTVTCPGVLANFLDHADGVLISKHRALGKRFGFTVEGRGEGHYCTSSW